ncbi:MAG: hypothetical protein M1436_01170 [Acidobacteria bacterium]|nr:hypothetical protein [Acidobacteriota bacterium]
MSGRALAGFFLSGFLFALPGAILPVWGYHRDPPAFVTVGNYFLCIAAGVLVSGKVSDLLLRRRGVPFLLVLGCSLACVALVFLAMVGPPAPAGWRCGHRSLSAGQA